jgi:hypothetical protein
MGRGWDVDGSMADESEPWYICFYICMHANLSRGFGYFIFIYRAIYGTRDGCFKLLIGHISAVEELAIGSDCVMVLLSSCYIHTYIHTHLASASHVKT